MENITKSARINEVSLTYQEEWKQIISLGVGMGYTTKEIERNPILLLHFFYSWLEENK